MSKHRFLAVVFLIALIVSVANIISISVNAESVFGFCGENMTWELNKATGELKIIGNGDISSAPWSGYASDIKSILVDNRVTCIEKGVFYGCSHLESITLPFAGDKRHTDADAYQYPFGYIFGEKSFDATSAVKQHYFGPSTREDIYRTFYIPYSLNSVTLTDCDYISYGAFDSCSINSINLPENLHSIGPSAFIDCKYLKSIEIPFNAENIGNSAFGGCTNLECATIPNFSTRIGMWAFPNASCLVIKCYESSCAYNFAASNNINCELLGKVTNVTVKQLPSRRIYPIKGSLNTNGLVLKVDMSDGSTFYVTDCFSIQKYDFSEYGVKTITVTCGAYSTAFKVLVDPEEIIYPESRHNYSKNSDEYWTISKPGASSISVTFSKNTCTESYYDFIYIYGKSDIQVGKYTGDELADKTVTVNGDSLKIRLTSDDSENEYGFAVINIKATYISGDSSGDGIISSDDLTALISNLLSDFSKSDERYDINCDGVCDIRDLIRFKMHLAKGTPLGK